MEKIDTVSVCSLQIPTKSSESDLANALCTSKSESDKKLSLTHMTHCTFCNRPMVARLFDTFVPNNGVFSRPSLIGCGGGVGVCMQETLTNAHGEFFGWMTEHAPLGATLDATLQAIDSNISTLQAHVVGPPLLTEIGQQYKTDEGRRSLLESTSAQCTADVVDIKLPVSPKPSTSTMAAHASMIDTTARVSKIHTRELERAWCGARVENAWRWHRSKAPARFQVRRSLSRMFRTRFFWDYVVCSCVCRSLENQVFSSRPMSAVLSSRTESQRTDTAEILSSLRQPLQGRNGG
jgi:hypothetical protein